MLLALALAARAEDLGTLLTQAKGSLLATDYVAARDILVAAEEAAPSSTSLVAQKDLARLFFYRGVVYWRASPESSAMEAWRQTLAIDPDFQPEVDLLPDPGEQDAFRALRAEVVARGDIVVDLPEDPGEATIFIDGRKLEPEDAVIAGQHFVQIRCEGGELVGSWYAYGAPPSSYLALCEGGSLKGTKTSKAKPTKSEKPEKPEKGEKPERAAKGDGEKAGLGGKDIAGITLLGLGAGGGGAAAYLYTVAAHNVVVWEAKEDAGRDQEADGWYNNKVVPSYLQFYGVTIASGVLLAAGTTLILIDVEGPVVAPLPGGGAMLGWNGRF
jgi:hypothetical protein